MPRSYSYEGKGHRSHHQDRDYPRSRHDSYGLRDRRRHRYYRHRRSSSKDERDQHREAPIDPPDAIKTETNHNSDTSTAGTKRHVSSSRERSRERERRRRKLQTECIKRAGGFQKLADSEGKEPVRLFWDGFQWVTRTGNSSTFQNDPSLINNTRKLRRLYFGNLPLHLGLTESLFQELIWIEMKNRNICNDPNQQPVLCVWFAKDKGNYGFVEFASVEETNRALEALDGMLCMGVPLKVSRPNNDHSGFGFFPNLTNHFAPAPQASVPGAALSTGTTRVVRFCKIIHQGDMEEDETWADFLDDIKNGCSIHGTITGSVIITPDKKDESPYGVGDVFLEFSTPLEAAACIAGMTGRRYLERPVTLMGIEDAVYNQLVKPLAAH